MSDSNVGTLPLEVWVNLDARGQLMALSDQNFVKKVKSSKDPEVKVVWKMIKEVVTNYVIESLERAKAPVVTLDVHKIKVFPDGIIIPSSVATGLDDPSGA